jgi:hypothetical protein
VIKLIQFTTARLLPNTTADRGFSGIPGDQEVSPPRARIAVNLSSYENLTWEL